MKTIDFLANPSSPHVRHWEMVLMQCGMCPIVHGIPQHVGTAPLVQQFRTVGPAWLMRLPAPMAYALAGLWLRCLSWVGRAPASFFHAHNTSGYGLMALFSGISYGVTTYGTEIYDAPRKSSLYRKMIRAVLLNARFITSTSPQMTHTLIEQLKIPVERIQEIYLGVAPVFSFSPELRGRGRSELSIHKHAKVWIANRRMFPIYHTVELVRAFNEFSALSKNTHLILIEGDADEAYSQEVTGEVARCPTAGVHILRGFLMQEILAKWLCAADFAISIPRSDQLSSSILESMRCHAVPVLGQLPAYQKIGRAAEWVNLESRNLHESLVAMFQSTSELSEATMQQKRLAGQEVLDELDNKDAILRDIHALYQRAR